MHGNYKIVGPGSAVANIFFVSRIQVRVYGNLQTEKLSYNIVMLALLLQILPVNSVM